MALRKRRGLEYQGRVEDATSTRDGIEFRLTSGTARLTFVFPGVVRVTVTRPGEDAEPSWAVIGRKPVDADLRVSSDDHEYVLETELLTITVNRDPFGVRFMDRAGRVLSEDASRGGAAWRGDSVYCEKRIMDGEHFYGFGEKAFALDRAGAKMLMWNTDHPFHKTGSDPLYVSIPFFIGLHSGAAYGLFFDSAWRSNFNMGGALKKSYFYSAAGGPLNYYFIAGPDMKEVLGRYTRLTGRMQLPPLWSLGYHQSRWSYKNESSVRRLAAKFRKLDIPCDVIHLDIHYMRGYRVFTWDSKRFPDPAGLAASMAYDGFKLVTIIDPGVKNESGYAVYDEGVQGDYFCRRANGRYFKGIVWPGETVFPDFIRGDVRDWWAGRVAAFLDSGVAGIWNDMNEPSINIKPYKRKIKTDDLEHVEDRKRQPHLKLRNVYGQAEAMATVDGQLRARPGERPFLLSRSGFAGIQRYAAIWSGDNTSNWENLWMSIPILSGMGLSGVPFVGADIGGFAGNCSPELYARWIQLGAFYPFCRTHTMLLSKKQEPWAFGKQVEKIAREYIGLRYRLMPYIYNSFRESAETGLPVMRPLVLEFQNDEPCFDIDDQFMFGPALLIAPVLQPGKDHRDVYLPPGEWIDFHTGERRPGSSSFRANAPLETMPIFIRSGCIIPMTIQMNYIGERDPDPLILNVECGADSELMLYEDDGRSFGYKDGMFTKIRYTYRESRGAKAFEAAPVETGYQPRRTHVVARFRGMDAFPEKVMLDGRPVHEAWLDERGPELPAHGWNYVAATRTLSVGFPEKLKPVRIEIKG